MTALLRADAIRLRHRYDLWIVLGGVLLLGTFFFLSNASGLAAQTQLPPQPIDPSLPPEIKAEIEAENARMLAQFAAMQDPYIFPWSIVTMLGQGIWVAMGAAFVAASWIGSEFDWGTVRAILLVSPRRGRFLATRVLAVVLVATVLLAAFGALGAILPLVVHLTGSGRPSGVDAGVILATAFGQWTWAVAFVAVATLAAVGTRSPVLALIVTYGYFLLDALVANLAFWKSLGLEWIPRFFLSQRLVALGEDIRAGSGVQEPYAPTPIGSGLHLDPTVGYLVIAAWVAAALGTAYVLFRRADIHE